MMGRIYPVLGLVVCLCSVDFVLAAEENLDVYAFANVENVDNLFRFSGDDEALSVLGSTNRSDTLTTFGVGGHLKVPVSRQKITLQGELRRTRYNRFDQLDNSNGELEGIWDWQIGSLLSGQLGYEYVRRISDFTELQQQVKDTEEQNRVYVSGTTRLHPRWSLTLGGGGFDTGFEQRPQLDRRESNVFTELRYATRANTSVGINISRTDADLDISEDVDPGAGTSLVSNDYDEESINVVGTWEVTGLSVLNVSLGTTKRDHDQVRERDFDGATGRLTYSRKVSGKTDVDISVFRATTTRNEVASLVVTEGIRIRPTWRITPKITFSGTFSYEEGDFEGSAIDAVNSITVREDEVTTVSGKLDYKFRRKASVFLGFNNISRDSNEASSEFNVLSIEAGVRARL